MMQASGKAKTRGYSKHHDYKVPIAVGIIALILIGVIGVVYLSQSSRSSNPALSSKIFYRPVFARIYSFNQWTLPAETPTTAGAALASTNASFVTGLIRFDAGSSTYANLTVSSSMAAAYTTVTNAVLAVNPKAEFDIWLRAEQFTNPTTGAAGSGADIVAAMKTVQATGLRFNAFSFDDANAMSTQAAQAVISYGHSVGKLVGLSWVPTTPLPTGVKPDYVLISDEYNFTTNQDQVTYTHAEISSAGVPVLLGINDGPTPVNSQGITEHAYFVQDMTDTQRLAMITYLSQNQKPLGYAFTYPVFGPVGQVGPPSIEYDSPNDGTILASMISLMSQYNAAPSAHSLLPWLVIGMVSERLNEQLPA